MVLRQQAAQRFGGNTEAAAQLPRELFEEQAKRRVVVGLLLGEVIKSEELKADDDKVKALDRRNGDSLRRSFRSYCLLRAKHSDDG